MVARELIRRAVVGWAVIRLDRAFPLRLSYRPCPNAPAASSTPPTTPLAGASTPERKAPPKPPWLAGPPLPPKKQTISIRREVKGRGGKTATVIYRVQVGEATFKDLAKQLREACGSGGSAKDGEILIEATTAKRRPRSCCDWGIKRSSRVGECWRRQARARNFTGFVTIWRGTTQCKNGSDFYPFRRRPHSHRDSGGSVLMLIPSGPTGSEPMSAPTAKDGRCLRPRPVRRTLRPRTERLVSPPLRPPSPLVR